jgi:hypothetical protein
MRIEPGSEGSKTLILGGARLKVIRDEGRLPEPRKTETVSSKLYSPG